MDYQAADRIEAHISVAQLAEVYRNKISYFQKSCKRAQLIFNVLSLLSIVLNIAGTIVGTSTDRCSPKVRFCGGKIALGILSGVGILIQTFLKLYEFEKKIYYRKLAVTQYKQIFNKIEAFRRLQHSGVALPSQPEEVLTSFITEINILEDLVSDVCPLVKLNTTANSK